MPGITKHLQPRDSSFMERMRAEVVKSQAMLRKEEADAYPNLRFGPFGL